MSMYVMFRLRVKGTKENCSKFAAVLNQYEGHCDDPYVAETAGTSDSFTMEIRGALRSDIVKYMIDVPAYEDSLEGMSKSHNLDIEVFGSDPGDGAFEYYYYKNGVCVESCNLPQYVSSQEEFEYFEISEDEQKKYEPQEKGGFVLRKEYLAKAEWDEAGEEMICQFKTELA